MNHAETITYFKKLKTEYYNNINAEDVINKAFEKDAFKRMEENFLSSLKALKKVNSSFNLEENDIKFVFDNFMMLTEAMELLFTKTFPKAYAALDRMIEHEGLEYADTIRIHDFSDKFILYYNIIRYTGCCGSMDEEIVISGKKYMVGCNFGH